MGQKQERPKVARRRDEKGDRVRRDKSPVVRQDLDEFIVELNDLITLVAVDLGSGAGPGSRRHLRSGK